MDITSTLLNVLAQNAIAVVLLFILQSQTKAHQSSIEYYRSQHEAMLKWVLAHADNHIQYIPAKVSGESGQVTPES